MEDRYQREKQFHDQAYDEGSRHVTDKYYKIADSRVKLYEDLLSAHCSDRRVLEYGCGQGGHAYFLAEKSASVTAIDLSETAIAQARETAERKNLDNADFRLMNAEDLDFEDSTFDMVCGTAILHHLDLHRAFSEIVRVLRPDGVAIFMEPLGHNPLINLYRKLTPSLRTEDEHPLRIEDFELSRTFFEKFDLYYFHLFSLIAVPFRNTRFFPQLLKALEGVDRLLFRYLPFMRRYAWYCVMVFEQPKKERT